MKVPIEQAKKQLENLIDRSAAGEDVVITRDGHPVARMVSIANGSSPAANGTAHDGPPQRLGWGKDVITSIAPDFDEPLEDFREYME